MRRDGKKHSVSDKCQLRLWCLVVGILRVKVLRVHSGYQSIALSTIDEIQREEKLFFLEMWFIGYNYMVMDAADYPRLRDIVTLKSLQRWQISEEEFHDFHKVGKISINVSYQICNIIFYGQDF